VFEDVLKNERRPDWNFNSPLAFRFGVSGLYCDFVCGKPSDQVASIIEG
jgi:hypothetical protein